MGLFSGDKRGSMSDIGGVSKVSLPNNFGLRSKRGRKFRRMSMAWEFLPSFGRGAVLFWKIQENSLASVRPIFILDLVAAIIRPLRSRPWKSRT